MNKKVIIIVGLLVIILGSITYCSYTYHQLGKYENKTTIVSNDNSTDSKIIESQPEQQIVETLNNNVNNKDDELSNFLQKVKVTDNLQEYEIIQVLKDDIDGDKNQEIIASFGTKSEDENYFIKSYLIRQTEHGLNVIKSDIELGGYYINGIDIVKLENSKNKYIYVKITNGVHPLGCAVYELKGDSLVTLFHQASPTGAGQYSLVDTDKNGTYNEIISLIGDYSVFFHPIETHYVWDGKSFDNKKVFYFIEEYPKEPEKVIEQYIDILWLEKNYGSNEQTQNRINNLLLNEDVKKIDLNEYIDNFYTLESQITGENNLKFEKSMHDNGSSNLGVDLKEGKLKKKLYFELDLDNGKWKISSITENLMKDEEKIIGLWHLSPHVAAGYNDRYYFYPDKTFRFAISDADAENRNIGYKGNWDIQNSKLIITILKELTLVGGYLECSPSALTGKAIKDGEIIEKDVNPIKTIEYDISLEPNKEGFLTITNSSLKFYKISSNPDI